jgi:hypothetical protein
VLHTGALARRSADATGLLSSLSLLRRPCWLLLLLLWFCTLGLAGQVLQ